jgi:hypothetical protein
MKNALKTGMGSATVPVAIMGVPPMMLGMYPARTPDTACETHALPLFCQCVKKSGSIGAICGSNRRLPSLASRSSRDTSNQGIKQLNQKIAPLSDMIRPEK